MPLLASERPPAVLFQDASVPSILHSQPAPRWAEESQGANQTGRSHPKPDQTVNCPGWASLLLARGRDAARESQDRRAWGGRAARRPRARGQHVWSWRHGCSLPRGAASGWLQGTTEESRRQGGKGGAEKVASVVARAAASREVAVMAPASGARRPGEGRGVREQGSVPEEG